MMSLQTEDIKNQFRIDGTDDDSYIASLISQAQESLLLAIDSQLTVSDMADYPIFDRAVALLVAHWYFNRQESSDSPRYQNLYGVDAIVNQLRGIFWDEGDTDGSDS